MHFDTVPKSRDTCNEAGELGASKAGSPVAKEAEVCQCREVYIGRPRGVLLCCTFLDLIISSFMVQSPEKKGCVISFPARLGREHVEIKDKKLVIR